MNRTLKAIIVAVALIVVGAVLAGCGLWGMNDAWNPAAGWEQFTGNKGLVNVEGTVSEEFTNIDMDIFWVDVQLLPSPDGTCHYQAAIHESMPCTVTVENGTLKVHQEDNRRPHEHISINWNEPTLKLYLPADTYDQLTVLAGTSDLMIPAEFTFGNVDITTSTGDVAFSAQVDGDMTLTCSTGDITLKGATAKTITASVSTGDVRMEHVGCDSLSVSTTTGQSYLSDVSVAGSLSAASGTGKKILTNVTCSSFKSRATTGDLEMTRVTVSGDAEITASTGDVEFTHFDAANITIETSTGDVDGTLLSEKIFFTDSSTGDVEVPRTTSGGTCNITTSTGDIEIDIVP